MKPFHFRLESVLALRAAKENEEQEIYARALQAVRQAERELADARMELERLHEALESARGGRSRRNDQLIVLNAIGYQRSVCDRKSERLEFVRAEASARLQDLLAAKRAHEILRRLKTKAHARYQREEERQEQNAVDDAVMAKFAVTGGKAAA
jgi:flagellar export protein FliJ